MQTNFTTQRLQLSALTLNHGEFILALVNTPGWLQFIGDRKIHTPDDVVAYINRINQNPAITYWVVSLTGEQTPIGIITFIKRDYLEYHDIGFAFLPAYAKLGYAFEATMAIINYLAKEHSLIRLLATTLPENTNSIKLLLKCGFTFNTEMDVAGEKLLIYARGL